MTKCELCGLVSPDISLLSIRITPPIEGVIDPDYERDHNVPVCAECSSRIHIACAMTEINEVFAIREESRERMERARDRVAFFMAQEEAEEEKAAKKAVESEKRRLDEDNGDSKDPS